MSMQSTRQRCGFAGVGLALLLLSASAWAKDYKSGEFETTHQYGFGAFEARVRAAKGPGVISTFFLWRPGSDTAPAIPWHEIDFEMGQASGDYQTQIMTPGSSPPLYRTEHVKVHSLPSRPWDAYYTYRMEWTPDYIAFFVDGKEVRRETDKQTFAALFDQDASGNTPTNERMELRTGVWPGAPNISGWAGNFDGSTLPTAHFVDYVKVWAYTPGQSNPFATLLLDDEFNSLNSSNWYPAQWTFDFSASDYVSQNIGTRNGRLVVALTTNAGAGILPSPPADVPPPIIPPPVVPGQGFYFEAEDYDAYSDSTPGNFGSPSCSSTDVDAEPTTDPKGGTCDVGWTTPAEWLEYHVTLQEADEYELDVRLASLVNTTYLHVEVDGVDVSGPISGPGKGWQAFSDGLAEGVYLSAGAHVIRLVFDTGDTNVNYLAFVSQTTGNACLQSCDDGNPCTTDSCDSTTGCIFKNNTLSCADDGNTCTSDVCSGGSCTHPVNGTCSTGGTASTPCSSLCKNPIEFTSASFLSGNLGSAAACYETTANLNGGVCGNFAGGRKLTINGTQLSCSDHNWPSPLPGKRNGGYCVQTTAGDYPWAYFVTW